MEIDRTQWSDNRDFIWRCLEFRGITFHVLWRKSPVISGERDHFKIKTPNGSQIWTVLSPQNLKTPTEESQILQYIFYFVQRDKLRARATNRYQKKKKKKRNHRLEFFLN
jgi:hypothetical protein